MEYIKAKTILSANMQEKGWFGCDYNMNLYRGCNHGCIYCDSRSECYKNDDFDKVYAKEDALNILELELAKKKSKGVISLGAMSDGYNIEESKHFITRKALEFIDRYHFGVCITTKSTLVLRDIDILQKIAIHSPAIVVFTITTAFDNQSKIIEPNAAISSKRFEAIKVLGENNVFAGGIIAPLLPFINDNSANIYKLVEMFKAANAKFVATYGFGVTLRDRQRAYFYECLDKIDKALKPKYIEAFGLDYMCNSPNSSLLYDVYKNECKKHDLLYRFEDIINAYKKPYQKQQLSFFD